MNKGLSVYEESVNTIEQILQNYHNDKSLRILDISCQAGSNEGDNYMSIIKRVCVKFNDKSSITTFKKFIVKRQILDETRRIAWRCDYAFKNEIDAYLFLIPELAKFCKKEMPYPKCYFAGSDEYGDIIIMEDLTQKGYQMKNRVKGLDYDHCEAVMKELAFMHSISLALKYTDQQKFLDVVSKINEVVFHEGASDFYSHVMDLSYNEALTSFMKFPTSNIKAIEKLKLLKSGRKMFDKMMKDVKSYEDSENFMVVAHGDLWINNIMFCYAEDGSVSQVKFVDLQTIRASNMVCDLLLFFYTSSTAYTRKRHLDQLIEIYRTSLISNLRDLLKEYNVEEKDNFDEIYSFKNIKDQLMKRSIFGLGMALWLMPAITFLPNTSLDVDSLMSSIMNTNDHDEIIASLQSNDYHVRIREVLDEFEINGYLDDIN